MDYKLTERHKRELEYRIRLIDLATDQNDQEAFIHHLIILSDLVRDTINECRKHELTTIFSTTQEEQTTTEKV